MELNERQHEITRLLKRLQQVSVNDLKRRFNTSAVTIRKDLEELQARGLLRRTHGGAMLPAGPEPPSPAPLPTSPNLEPLEARFEAIAEAAMERLFNCETVALGAGRATVAIARRLRQIDVQVVTNALPVLNELAGRESGGVIALGGLWHPGSQSYIGPLALQTLARLNLDIAYVGADAFSPAGGFTCASTIEAQLLTQLLARAERKFIVADSTHYGPTLFATFAALADVDALITDDQLPEDAYTQLTAQGLNIVTARVK